jgi:uncharacterized protein (TIGR03437 family)
MQIRSSYTFIPLLLAAGCNLLQAQTISVDNTTINLVAQYQGSPVSAPLNVTSSTANTPFSVFVNNSASTPWLKLNSGQLAVNGNTNATVTVVGDPTGLNPGTYKGTLNVFGGASSTATMVTVNLQVSTLGINPSSVTFTPYVTGTSTFPALQSLTVAGTAPHFTAVASVTSPDPQWFSVIPTSGDLPGTVITATVNNGIVATLSVGVHTGAITVTPVGSNDTTPVKIPVSLTVTAAPQVSINPTSLIFNIQNPANGGNTNKTTKSFTVSVTPPTSLNLGFTALPDPGSGSTNWLVCCTLVPPSSTTDPTTGKLTATVAVNPAGLNPGTTYTGKVTVIAAGGSPSSSTVPVTLVYSNNQLLDVPNDTVNFTYQLGGAKPAAQQVNITATSGTLAYTFMASSVPAGWLSAVSTLGPGVVPPNTGNTSGPISVSVDPTGLPPGTYNGSIAVTSALQGSTPQQFPVVLTVTNNPSISTNVDSMSFPFQLNQTAPQPQTLKISSSTGVPLSYTATASTATCGNSWLQFLNVPNPASGTTDGTIQVGINTSGLTAATCTGSIIINASVQSTGASVGSKTIPVTLLVTTTPQLLATPTSLTFSVQQGAASPAGQTITLASTSGATDVLSYTVTPTGSSNGTQWLLSGLSGTTATGGTLPVSVFSSTLPAGTYSGNLTIAATTSGGTAVANSPVTIPVTLQVTSGSLTLSNTQLNFAYTVGAASPASQTVTVGSSTSQSLVYTAVATSSAQNPWLSVTPANGNTSGSGTLTISVDGTKLTTAGNYNGSITVTSPGAGNSPATINVQVVVTAGTISAPTTQLNFTQVIGGPAPAAQSVMVNSTPAGLQYTVGTTVTSPSNGTWLSATPANGTATSNVSVSVNGSGLPAGQYNGSVVITSSGASGSPITVPVVLTVVPATQMAASPTSLTFNYTIGLQQPAAQNLNISASPSAPFTITGSSNAPWLNVTPSSGTAPSTVSVSVITASIAAGTYNATITISSPNLVTPVNVAVTLNVQTVAKPVIASITNAGSYTAGAVSPGENIVIFGTGIGPSDLAKNVLTNNAFGPTAGNTRVLFDGVPAPIIYASATQTSAMVPYGVAGRSATNIVVEYLGVQSTPVPFVVVNAAPGIYTLNQAGTGPGAILNQDGVTINGPNAAEKRGNVISVYMTGEGQTNPGGADGVIIPPVVSALKNPVLPVTAKIGGVDATVAYAGSAAGLVSGVMQVNIFIPATAPTGNNVPIVISVGGTATQSGVTVAVQ